MVIFTLLAILTVATVAIFLIKDFRTFAILPLALILIISGLTSVYRQPVGQASVITSAGGDVVGYNDMPGWGFKAPWQSRTEFDLFSQTLTYAGSNGEIPEYTGGSVLGQEVTASVAKGVKVNFDVSFTYNLDGDKVAEIFKKYQSQEKFTSQVVNQRALTVFREVPTQYTTIEFKGDKRSEAQSKMLDKLKEVLSPYGVDVTAVNLQAIRYDESVEESIRQVETAQQKEAQAQAELRQAEVKAQEKVAIAKAEAEANNILTQSLTPQLLQQRWIEALKESKSTIVVPDGTAPIISVPSE